MSFDHATFTLEDNGFVQVSGINNNPVDNAKSNGSGKSSWTDALCWALTGKTVRGTKDVVNINSDDGCYVRVLFSVDDKEYEILRSKNHSVYKTNLKIIVDSCDKSGKGIKDSEQLLSEYLPELTYKLINSVILLGQGLPERFTNNTPSGRKEMLEQLTNSDFMIDDIKRRVSLRKTLLDSEKTKFHEQYIKSESKISTLKSSLQDYEKKLSSIPDISYINNQISTLTDSQKSKEDELEQLKSSYNIITKVVDDDRAYLQELTTKYNDKCGEISSTYRTQIDTYKSKIISAESELRVLRNELNRMLSIKDTCPTCGQKLPNAVKPDTSEIESQIDALVKNKEELSKQLVDIQSEQERELNKEKELFDGNSCGLTKSITSKSFEIKDMYNNINNISSELFKIVSEINRLSSYVSTIDSTKADISSSIESTKKQISDEEEQLLYIKNNETDIDSKISAVNKINSVITRDFRGYLLADVIAFVDSKCKEYCKYVFDNDKISFELDGNNLVISYNGKEYECLSGGEKQKINIIVQFALRSMLCSYVGFSSNVLVLDEVFDNLDSNGCQNIVTLICETMTDVDSVYIITHHGDLQIPYDKELIIVKNSEGMSSIQ